MNITIVHIAFVVDKNKVHHKFIIIKVGDAILIQAAVLLHMEVIMLSSVLSLSVFFKRFAMMYLHTDDMNNGLKKRTASVV
jgi:hypothetical protein